MAAITSEDLAPRTRLLLGAPVLATLLRLSAPNLAEALARVTFLTADAVFVSWLGGDALAAVSIVFPLLLIFQTSTASGFGAGVSASIGHALGAGDRARAARLAGTAVALALLASLASTALLVPFGPALYRLMGASGATLDLAIAYGTVIFSGIVLVWLMNIMANVARGAGNMVASASAIFIGEACHLVLSPALILGWGPLPQLGVVGAAIGALSAYAVGAAVLALHLCSRRALARVERLRVGADETRAILDVGAPAAASSVTFWIATLFTAGLVGQLGSAPVAAFGMATRLEAIQYPIIFAFGSAVVTMVATATGAGDRARAARVAWTGCVVAALIAGAFTIVGFFGTYWMALFTTDPVIRELGALYLLFQAPIFPLFGAGVAAFFACTGLGQARLPFVVSLARLLVVAGGGWLALKLTGGAWSVFLAMAAGGALFGAGLLAILRRQVGR
jgi:putative MATE family efflux protein